MSSAAGPCTIGTHSGTFHCDEALAVYLLLQTRQFAGSSVVRSRDPARLDPCDVVVDVGGVYDPAKHRYDHHQRGFTETFSPKHVTKLSSAGLVYKHYGREIVASRISVPEDSATVDVVYEKLYEHFVESLDAVDNGIPQYPNSLMPAYKECTTLPARVALLNPAWNQKDVDVDKQFMKAVELTGSEFSDRLSYISSAWLPARGLVVAAMEERKIVHQSGKVLVFRQACPWKDHLDDVEKDMKIEEGDLPVYSLFAEGDDPGTSTWRIQGIPKAPGSFETRKPMPEAWGGLREDDLSRVTGIPGCVFVHAGRWIGGNKTYEGALRMALAALEATP